MKTIALSILFLLGFSFLFAQSISPDDTKAAEEKLVSEQLFWLGNSDAKAEVRAAKLLQLGLWSELNQLLSNTRKTDALLTVEAEYLIAINDFKKAENIVTELIRKNRKNYQALALQADLLTQAWRLSEAEKVCTDALKSVPENISILYQLGKIKLLQKQYGEVKNIAQNIQKIAPSNGLGYLLEADAWFWNQEPEKAEAPLLKSLELDPFNADARFSYGYAIWRRVDATQLPDMAAQWALALKINPLHYLTHWHWGNGHTQLTYADYARPDDEEVRKALLPAEELIRQNKVREAIAFAQGIRVLYPQSVLPDMFRASAYYMGYDLGNFRLDSAQNIFQNILQKKKNYGPAHNGLATVIKSKRLPYLAFYDSVQTSLKNTVIPDEETFAKIFPDVTYYPGNLVKNMVWNQLYTSTAYFPFLAKQNRRYVVPPLHIDLTIAMRSPFFRQATTFDNRQWMDIRGVGSGAAAIEYVERGAYLERNVLLHEFVHLFHGQVLTDAENRKIRELYFKAMQKNLTLDYYSRNNEHEYFAQTYPAFFEPMKVHPLDFKSMNTTSDLKTKDPEMYAFLAGLVAKEKAQLAGNEKAMTSNWAQVYINLSEQNRGRNPALAANYLDTALVWDEKYIPIYLSYARLHAENERYDLAKQMLSKATELDALYAPTYITEAEIEEKMYQNGIGNQNISLLSQEAALKQAVALESDLLLRADMYRRLQDFYLRNAMTVKAIEVGFNYSQNAPDISTYLRDRRDELVAIATYSRAVLGHKRPLDVLADLVRQKPQNYWMRGLYADALAANGFYDFALDELLGVQKILVAAGTPRSDYEIRIAEYYVKMGLADSAKKYYQSFVEGRNAGANTLRLIRLLADAGETESANQLFIKQSEPKDKAGKIEYKLTQAKVLEANLDVAGATSLYQEVLGLHPYQYEAAFALLKIYKRQAKFAEAAQLVEFLQRQEIAPGNTVERMLEEI